MIRHSILAHSVFSHHYHTMAQLSSMLGVQWNCVGSKLKKIQGKFQIFMLASFSFTNMFGWYGNEGVI